MMGQTTLTQPRWENINYHKEIEKLMYPDGFHKKKQHGLWKLKIKLNKKEWEAIKPLFQFYDKKEEENNIIQNMTYYGWATIKPVQVMKILYTLRNRRR